MFSWRPSSSDIRLRVVGVSGVVRLSSSLQVKQTEVVRQIVIVHHFVIDQHWKRHWASGHISRENNIFDDQ